MRRLPRRVREPRRPPLPRPAPRLPGLWTTALPRRPEGSGVPPRRRGQGGHPAPTRTGGGGGREGARRLPLDVRRHEPCGGRRATQTQAARRQALRCAGVGRRRRGSGYPSVIRRGCLSRVTTTPDRARSPPWRNPRLGRARGTWRSRGGGDAAVHTSAASPPRRTHHPGTGVHFGQRRRRADRLRRRRGSRSARRAGRCLADARPSHPCAMRRQCGALGSRPTRAGTQGARIHPLTGPHRLRRAPSVGDGGRSEGGGLCRRRRRGMDVAASRRPRRTRHLPRGSPGGRAPHVTHQDHPCVGGGRRPPRLLLVAARSRARGLVGQ